METGVTEGEGYLYLSLKQTWRKKYIKLKTKSRYAHISCSQMTKYILLVQKYLHRELSPTLSPTP